MKKGYVSQALITMALFGVVHAGPVMAGGQSASMEALQRQMQELIDENRQLAQRVGELEGKVAEANTRAAEKLMVLEGQQSEERDPKRISDFVRLSGLIETQLAVGDNFEGEGFSSFDVSTMALVLDIQATDWVAGRVLVKYEEEGDEEDFTVDEATITLGNTEKHPLTLTVGKFYMPFGNYVTNMIQDPLTLEIGEINDSGAAIGFSAHGFTAAIYGYKGMDKAGENDTLGYGVMASYCHKQDDFSFTGGLGWTGNMADSDGAIADVFDEKGLGTVEKRVDGFDLHVGVGVGQFSFFGEYVTALDDFAPAEVEFLDRGARPRAWNAELAYTTGIFDRETVFAVGWQQTDEAVALELPESRYIGSVGMEILPDTFFTLEYYHDRDYDLEDGGTGNNANVFTVELAYEF